MSAFRSILFNLFFIFGTLLTSLAMTVLLPLPRRFTLNAFQWWIRTIYWVLKTLVGLDYEFRGREHLPSGPVVIASKHQSAWDTGAFFLLTRDPAYVLKKELLNIPFYGWCLRKAAMISIDRDGGAKALKGMVREVQAALKANRQVIVFPEGTRTVAGERRPFHPGIAAIYAATKTPLVPVAVNSGLFWGRRSFLKHPGTVILEVLPAIPKGLNRRAFMAELESRINTATERLDAETRARFPHTDAPGGIS